MITKSILRDKLLYSMLILIMYVFGQNVPIPWVVTPENALGGGGIQQYFRELMTGSQTVVSVFSLGLMPWMTASIVWQIFQSITRDNKSKTSSRKNYQKSMVLALLVAILQGTVYTSSLQFSVPTHDYDALLRIMTVITMIAGSSIVIVLASSNNRYGIGGTSFLILGNITERLLTTAVSYWGEMAFFRTSTWNTVTLVLSPILWGLIVIIVTVIFERGEIRIPISRVMIHNSFSDEDYIAVKMNPAGTMPAMFVMTFFAIPYYLLRILSHFYPDNKTILWWLDNLTITNYTGLLIFLLLLIALTLTFSFIIISPSNIAEQFEKSGDLIPGLRPGKSTKHYLRHILFRQGLNSGFAMAVVLGVPLSLQILLKSESQIFMAPITLMILTGITATIIDQVQVIREMTQYKPFL